MSSTFLRLIVALVFCFHVTVEVGANPITKSKLCEVMMKMDCKESTEKPVCGSDGKVYQNSCFFGQAVCSISDPGLRLTGGKNCDQ
ncbi:SPARC-related modular calcium-binding protein 2-like [Ostrea edulis]|uniref:SPARC-related modular calcium-binding protein 2-like n=1 Tax=Ostrea edulis TaxID=37623 RepID=UPI0024AF9DEE|nr:SPARC-related modular calcium-binding protein 2-like [Ostrea edulis]